MKKLIALLALFSFLSACGDSAPPAFVLAPERVVISGAGDLGIFDPSVTRDPGDNRLWMSYSSVDTSIYYASNLYWTVSLRLAYSDDNGNRWTDAGVVTAAKVEALVGPMSGGIIAGSQGIWQSETSSLIYDPSAPAAERWKLIWFQYLNANLINYFAEHSWIALKMAATPQELATAPAVKLFGGAGLQSDGSNTAAPVFSPTGGTPAIALNTQLTQAAIGANLSDLNSCVFAEPGLHATSAGLFLAIFCANTSTVPIIQYLEYFQCASPCTITSASSWEYLGRLLTATDAQAATADDHYQAPNIVESKGQTYLIVTPVDTTSGDRYNGCRIYQFSNVSSRALLRNNGQLVQIARIDGDDNTHNGACTDFSGLNGGVLYSQFEATSPVDTFNVYRSKVKLP